MITAMGLDVATVTGCVILREKYQSPEVIYAKEISGKGFTGIDRCAEIANPFVEVLEEFKPTIITMEGYNYNNAHSLVVAVEIATVLKYFIRQHGMMVHLVAPGALKKFVLGTGRGKKSLILKGVYKRWGFDTESEDIADAYGLACVGLALKDKLGDLIKPQQEVIERIRKTEAQ